ncbi:MAG: cytochrome c oxidase subunit 3 [Candidatus Sulfotelmatobacter sp.]
MFGLIAAECAVFAIFVVAYLFYVGKSISGPLPKDVLSVPIFYTICLLSSSLTIHLAVTALRRGKRHAFSAWWFATITLGTVFLFGTGLEWRRLIYHDGLTISTNLFGTTYYSLVGLHAFHVVVGLLSLSFVMAFAILGRVKQDHAERIDVLSLYWHFVDSVWDSGRVCIGSEDIVHSSEEELSRVRRHMGFLFQSAALLDSFSLEDNLALPLRRLDKSKSPSEIKRAVYETLERVGLDLDIAKMPSELSGGMRKRAGLARALVLHPKLLLVDEPSSGLDRITASEIDDLLLKVKKEYRATLVIVTHDVRGARRVGDRIAVLDQGRLIGFGTATELDKSDHEIVRRLVSES